MFHSFARVFVRLGSMRIRSQLLLTYSIAGLLPILLLGAYLVSNGHRLALQQYYDQTAADNKRVKMIAFHVTYLAMNISEAMLYDDQLRNIVSMKYTDNSQVYEAYRKYTLPNTYLANYTEFSGITIYVNNRTMLTNGRFKVVTDDIAKCDWYRRAASGSGGTFWIVDPSFGQSSFLTLVRKITLNNNGDFAVLVINISNNYMKLMINDDTFHTVAALNNGPIFFSDDLRDIGRSIPIKVNVDNPQMTQDGKIQYKGLDAIYSARVQPAIKTGDSFQVLTIDSTAPRRVQTVLINDVLIIAVSLIVPSAIILLFLRVFNRRIVTLRREMHKVAGGDFNIIDRFNGHDELSDVFTDMKTMIDCICTEKLARERLLTRQQRIEFEMLSSQINPHFLFNTLETIRMKALMNGDREGARSANLLSKSMRHVLEVGHAPVSLSSEIEYIKIYLEIQALRFGEKIGSEICISEDVDADQYLILPLLLQPVIENSVVHGLEGKDGKGCVKICVRYDGDKLLIVISDDGIGMELEDLDAMLENIRNSVAAQAKAGIGLTNVHQRIRLYYGPAYGLSMCSQKSKGTVVTLTLPGDGKGLIGNDRAVC